jgi:hypothetical protein
MDTAEVLFPVVAFAILFAASALLRGDADLPRGQA